ncbi:MAG: glycoside hydrolase family 15 protein [Candidatus Kryptoniota bacterium]
MSVKTLLFLPALFLVSNFSFAQTVLLPERWLFSTTDSLTYSTPSFDDGGWKVVDVPSSWDYLGVAWYRTHFGINKSLQDDSVYLVLGMIDDADESYLNGVKIGGMGKFPPDPQTAYDRLRIYKISRKLLKKDNVLAIRVYNMMGPGGLVRGPIGIFNDRDFHALFNPPPGPKKSFHQLVTSNGLVAAVYNEQRKEIEYALPHIFQAYDSSRAVKPFILRLTPSIDSNPIRTYYDHNTHVITVNYPHLKISYFAPFTIDKPVLCVYVSGRKEDVGKVSFSYEEGTARVVSDSTVFLYPTKRTDKYYIFGYSDSLHNGVEIVREVKRNLVVNGGDLITREISYMREVFAKCKILKELNLPERQVAEQSIAVLKMAQVSESEVFPLARGQILASLPPGGWNISWVRDGTYSILALNRLGLFYEARQFLSFMLNAESNHYDHFIYTDGKDYGVGVPYQISVCRYFGIGKEESDFNQDGPNIELDGFGLILIALSDYVNRSQDTLFFLDNYQKISRKVLNPIVHSIYSNGLIRKESGPWERHLPGKQFAYTSIVCAAGIRDFYALANKLNLKDAKQYREAYVELLNGIQKNLIVNRKLIKGNAEAKDPSRYDYFDGGTFEAFALRLITDKALFESHMKSYRSVLGVPGGIHGFSRINNGDWYETAEWILLDLRAASAFKNFGDQTEALALIKWVTDQASLNFGLIPELYNRETSTYDGAVPMVGFGAGAYIIAISDFYSN